MPALVAACVWVVVAGLISLLPRRLHPPGAYALAATGIPILGWVTWTNGPFWGLLCLLGGASVLRWPLIRLARRVRR
jgi:hypothetical protein